MRMRLSVFFFGALAWMGQAQPTVYLRSGGPAGFVVTGASNTTPVVVQTAAPMGSTLGDPVVIWGVGASVSGKCILSTANGIRLVKAVVDTTHFSITDQNGVDVTANGAWCDGSASVTGRPRQPGKLTPYTAAAQPRGWLMAPPAR